MDNVTFGRTGRNAETWKLHRAATAMSGVAMPGRSLMSMNACLNMLLKPAADEGNRTVVISILQQIISALALIFHINGTMYRNHRSTPSTICTLY